MKSTFLLTAVAITFLTAFTQTLHAQSPAKKREVGLQLSGINFDGSNTFNVLLKKELKENRYRRLRLFTGNISISAQNDEGQGSFSAGLAIGKEKRKSLGDKLQFFHGPEFSPSVDFLAANETALFNLHLRFGWVLGLQHDFNDHWAINIEMVPGARFSLGGNDDDDDLFGYANFSAGINNTVSLAVMRKF